MANRNLRVIGHWEDASGLVAKHHGTSLPFNVNVAMAVGSDGAAIPSVAAIRTALSNNGKVPGSLLFVVETFANLDAQHNAGILS
jgi:hypothetical protein